MGVLLPATENAGGGGTRPCRVQDDARLAGEEEKEEEEELLAKQGAEPHKATAHSPEETQTPEVTLVTQATVNYVPFVFEIARRWAPCPMSAAIYGKVNPCVQLS